MSQTPDTPSANDRTRRAVIVVAGPPGAGKTTFVEQRRKPGDVVIDTDEIWRTLTGLPWYDRPLHLYPIVKEIRRAAIAAIARTPAPLMAWVIGGYPDWHDRRRVAVELGATGVSVLAVPAEECIRRIAADHRRADQLELWTGAVGKWWRDYVPG